MFPGKKSSTLHLHNPSRKKAGMNNCAGRSRVKREGFRNASQHSQNLDSGAQKLRFSSGGFLLSWILSKADRLAGGTHTESQQIRARNSSGFTLRTQQLMDESTHCFRTLAEILMRTPIQWRQLPTQLAACSHRGKHCAHASYRDNWQDCAMAKQ